MLPPPGGASGGISGSLPDVPGQLPHSTSSGGGGGHAPPPLPSRPPNAGSSSGRLKYVAVAAHINLL